MHVAQNIIEIEVKICILFCFKQVKNAHRILRICVVSVGLMSMRMEFKRKIISLLKFLKECSVCLNADI